MAWEPFQKADILKGNLIPQLTYLADQANVKEPYLESLDLAIQTVVEEWLNLPTNACGAILYSSTQDGRLGITRLSALIPNVQS